MVGIDIDIRRSHALAHHPPKGDRRVVEGAEPGCLGGAGMMEPSAVGERDVAGSCHDEARPLEGASYFQALTLEHPGEDRVIPRPESVAPVRHAGVAFAQAPDRGDVLARVEERQFVFGCRRRRNQPHPGEVEGAVGRQKIVGALKPFGSKGMAPAMLVGPELGRGEEGRDPQRFWALGDGRA
jgi:hypothetical protein